MEFSIKLIKDWLSNFIFFLYLVAVVFIPINLHITNKIILLTGFLSFLFFLTSPVRYFDRRVIVLVTGMFLLGAIDLSWYEFYKTNDVVYKNAYRGYLEAGKMLLFCSFTLLFLNKSKSGFNIKFHLIAVILMQLVVLLRSYYQSLILHADRIPLSAMNGNIGQMGAATIAAYVITFCALYASIVFMKLDSKYKWVFFYINFTLSFVAVMMTGTRAAIVSYPMITIAMLYIQHRNQRVFLFKGLAGVFILLFGCGLLFSKEIENRVKSLQNDINLYTTKNNSRSSVGARFSMIRAGVEVAPEGLSWQSLEQRAINIKELSKENNIYKGATEFLDVHMHNEVVEALSTKGVFGVIFLLFFYTTMIYYCIREKQYLLLVFPAAIILFGLSDVITHAKPIPAAWIVCLFLSTSLLTKKEEEK